MSAVRWVGFVLTLAGALLSMSPVSSGDGVRQRRLARLPQTVLWAWERPEDLSRLPVGTGVAFHAQTITIDSAGPTFTPRRYPLKVDVTVPLVAVTRFETPVPRRTVLIDAEQSAIVDRIVANASLPGVVAVQIDFDATLSQRQLYIELLRSVRSALPVDVPLSMTALASWCVGDRWLDKAAADEVVPMLFRMGRETGFLRDAAWRRSVFEDRCQRAVGVSLDEPVHVARQSRRVYLFNPQSWTRDAIAAVEIGE